MTMRATTVMGYIVQGLVDEGITDCFGVPGDYAFPVCDAVERNPNVKWIGCSNELPFGSVGNSGMGKYHGEWGFGPTQARAGFWNRERTLRLANCATRPHHPNRTLRQIVMPS